MYLLLLALLQDTTAFYTCVIVLLIAPIIFWAKPWITRRATPSWAAERTSGAAGQMTAKGTRRAADAIIAVDGVAWILAYPFIRPGISYRAEVTCQYIPEVTHTDWRKP
jgi:hypothetical protein